MILQQGGEDVWKLNRSRWKLLFFLRKRFRKKWEGWPGGGQAMETLLQKLVMTTSWQGKSTPSLTLGRGRGHSQLLFVPLGWYSFWDQLGGGGDFQEECTLSDETSILIYCKQWTPLKAHLHFPNTFCTWIFVFFPEAQESMHEELPSASQTVMGADSVPLSENQRLSEFPLQNKTTLLWTFSGKFRN